MSDGILKFPPFCILNKANWERQNSKQIQIVQKLKQNNDTSILPLLNCLFQKTEKLEFQNIFYHSLPLFAVYDILNIESYGKNITIYFLKKHSLDTFHFSRNKNSLKRKFHIDPKRYHICWMHSLNGIYLF